MAKSRKLPIWSTVVPIVAATCAIELSNCDPAEIADLPNATTPAVAALKPTAAVLAATENTFPIVPAADLSPPANALPIVLPELVPALTASPESASVSLPLMPCIEGTICTYAFAISVAICFTP